MKKTFKEFIKTPGYSEGPMSLVTHNGVLYKLDRIFELSIDLPVTMMPIEDLKWMLQSPGIVDDKRMAKADTKVPIIVTPQNGRYVIIDGMHRVMKALKNNDKEIPCRVIFHDVLAMARMGSGPNTPWASAIGDMNPYLNEGSESKKDYDARMRRLAAGFEKMSDADKQKMSKIPGWKSQMEIAQKYVKENPIKEGEEEKEKKVEVKKDPTKFATKGTRYAIFVDDELVEGGFRDRENAVEQARDYGYKGN